jgi:hypothetical protein
LRSLVGDEHALAVIHEGVGINKQWGLLWLQKAVIEQERGQLELAEQTVIELLSYHDSMALPIRLAVALAKFRSESDHTVALRYLRMAGSNVHAGMYDPVEFFFTWAKEAEAVGLVDESIRTLQWGLSSVAGPPLSMARLQRALVDRLARYRPDEFLAKIATEFSSLMHCPHHVIRSLVNISVDRRDLNLLISCKAGSRHFHAVLSQAISKYIRDEDTAAVQFLCRNAGSGELDSQIVDELVQYAMFRQDARILECVAAPGTKTRDMLVRQCRAGGAIGDRQTYSLLRSVVGDSLSAADDLLLEIGSLLPGGDDISDCLRRLSELKEMHPDVARHLLLLALAALNESLVQIVRPFIPPTHSVGKFLAEALADGDSRKLHIIESVFGALDMTPWLCMFFVSRAFLDSDAAAAAAFLRRTREPETVIQMLKKRHEPMTEAQTETLEKILARALMPDSEVPDTQV